MNNPPPDLQRIYNDLKSKVIEQKEKASEELRSNFKNYVDFYEDVKEKKSSQSFHFLYFRSSLNCKSLSIVVIRLKKWVHY